MDEQSKNVAGLSQRLIGNVIWNFFGQGWLAALAFFSTPFIVRKLNVNLYGIYTFVGVIIGYFSFLQFGLVNASIKYISGYLANREEREISKVFWACLFAYIFIGLLGVATINSLATVLVERFLKIPAELKEISIFVLRLGSWGFLIYILLGAVSSVFYALGRFDILNWIIIVLGSIQIITTVILLKIGFSLKEIIIASLIINALGIYICWAYVKKLLPFLSRPCWDIATFVKLLRFGGFVTISDTIKPVLFNIEKVFLSSLHSISNLTYYAVPFALVDRLSIIRSSFSSVLFPTLSSCQGSHREEIGEELHFSSTLFIFFPYLFFIFFFLYFSKAFLGSWIGNDFAHKSAKILIILSFAGLTNALSSFSFIALQGLGKPHIPAFFHLIEMIVYIPLSFVLIKHLGGLGAAIAWFLRCLSDMVLMHRAICNLFNRRIFSWYRRFLYRAFIPAAVCGLSFCLLKSLSLKFLSLLNICGIFLTLLFYSYAVWRWGLDKIWQDKIAAFLRGLLR